VGKCKEDIFTEHAPLIHKSADIQQQTEYLNGVLPATIIDIEGGNVQRFIENWLSKTGLPIKCETPSGIQNSINLFFTTEFEFIPDSIEVFLSGNKLNGDQNDPNRDFDVVTVGVNKYKGFQFRLNTNRPQSLNTPPFQDECLLINYNKRVTFNTKGGT